MANYNFRKFYGCTCADPDDLTINDMESWALASKGHHIVRILDWEKHDAVYAECNSPNQRPQMLKQPYFELTFRDTKTNELITTKVFAAGLQAEDGIRDNNR